jgi:hypothetical protein
VGKELNPGTASTTLPGIVQKVIPSPDPKEPDKAQIAVEGGDDLYREIRIKNTLVDKDGTEVRLKPGAEVEVTIEAEPQATVKKHPGSATAAEPKG